MAENGALNVETFHALKMRLSSSRHVEASDVDELLSCLDSLLGCGLCALSQARDDQASAKLEAANALAEMTANLLAAQSQVQLHQYTIDNLKAEKIGRDIELHEARERLAQAANSAQNLAGTLASQESEIVSLQDALKASASRTEELWPPATSEMATGVTNCNSDAEVREVIFCPRFPLPALCNDTDIHCWLNYNNGAHFKGIFKQVFLLDRSPIFRTRLVD